MKSKMAMSDLHDLIDDGLQPTPEDIITINALGVKVEQSEHSSDLFEMPRVAYLGNLTFREPTIGHGMWIDAVMKYCADDYSTLVAVNTFALTRMNEELPDCNKREECEKAIDIFIKEKLNGYTFPQINSALNYVINGNDAASGERAITDNVVKDHESEQSIYVGVQLQTITLGLGISLADLRTMTLSQCKALQDEACRFNGIDITKSRKNISMGDYYATLNAIRERLEKEKNEKKD